ncbi:hypothetical protein KNE206_16750 [Kitasatospora sp. NE20-6]|uniref:SCO6745 family protein n=1 Tax=Kitasatospora sp. NE20-6 TaxID=2859066 RepID=UPI0034DC6641
MTTERALPRRAWHHLEPLHAVLYYAPEMYAEAAALGFATDTRWPSYFAWRTAPLGAASAALTTAVCYGFSPATVSRHVPAAWSTATPEAVLAARLRAVDAFYRNLPGGVTDSPGLAEAAVLARAAAEAASCAGRPLAAANAALPWPDEPHLVLWQAATVLREHRGDGHLAALLAAGLDPCESLVSLAATGAVAVADFAGRGWTDEEWAAATERLAVRGWVDAEGRATERGRAGRNDVEFLTDRLASGPWDALGAERTGRLLDLLGPLFLTVVRAGLFPPGGTLGIMTVPAPSPPSAPSAPVGGAPVG